MPTQKNAARYKPTPQDLRNASLMNEALMNWDVAHIREVFRNDYLSKVIIPRSWSPDTLDSLLKLSEIANVETARRLVDSAVDTRLRVSGASYSDVTRDDLDAAIRAVEEKNNSHGPQEAYSPAANTLYHIRSVVGARGPTPSLSNISPSHEMWNPCPQEELPEILFSKTEDSGVAEEPYPAPASSSNTPLAERTRQANLPQREAPEIEDRAEAQPPPAASRPQRSTAQGRNYNVKTAFKKAMKVATPQPSTQTLGKRRATDANVPETASRPQKKSKQAAPALADLPLPTVKGEDVQQDSSQMGVPGSSVTDRGAINASSSRRRTAPPPSVNNDTALENMTRSVSHLSVVEGYDYVLPHRAGDERRRLTSVRSEDLDALARIHEAWEMKERYRLEAQLRREEGEIADR